MLTTMFNPSYTESLKTITPAFTPRQRVFFMPMAWMRAENTQYQPKHCVIAFSESTPLLILRAFLRKITQMTNSISIYNFKQNQIRTQSVDGNPWFCLADCCKALGIKQNRDTATRLSQAGVGKTDTLTNGGNQKITFINEPNLYRLIFRSNKPQAQAFADWVYSEVLPSIRKTGAYAANNAPRREDWEIDDKDLIYFLNRWHATKNKKDTLEFRRLNSEIEELRRKLAAIKKEVQ